MPSAAAPTQRQLSKGEMIFRQGDPGHCMYIMLQGRVRLILGEPGRERELTTFQTGDFFGELAVLSGEPRSASAEVTEDATVLEIGPETFQMMVHDDLAIVRRIMEVQGQRVARTNQPIQELSKRLRTVGVAVVCLRALRAGATSLSLADLEKRSGLAGASLSETTSSLEQLGAGRVEGSQWIFATPDADVKFLDAMSKLSAGE